MTFFSCTRWAVALSLLMFVDGYYVSYETPRSYTKGERIPISANKLTSSKLMSMDYSQIALCGSPATNEGPAYGSINYGKSWSHAVSALHGDALRDIPASVLSLPMKQDLFCQQMCVAQYDTSNGAKEALERAIRDDFHYEFVIDDMPVAYRWENEERVAVRYWGGVPVGQMGENDDTKQSQRHHDARFVNSTETDLYIHNHYNFEIMYWKIPNTEPQEYRVIRTTVQPFSIEHHFDVTADSVPATMYNPVASCVEGNAGTTGDIHTYYSALTEARPQQVHMDTVQETQRILFTYDVIWVEWKGQHDPFKTRWNIFLKMDDGIPLSVQLFGLLVALLVNAIVYISLWTWIMRDLSYKPINLLYELHDEDNVEDGEERSAQRQEEQEKEIQLWPLSTWLFFPPRVAPLWFCISFGMGAQILLAAFLFVLFFRLGIVNESLGANLLTSAVVFYTLASFWGGYVTGRLYSIFHGPQMTALQACFAVAAIFPILGMIVFHLCYDVFPDASFAPHFRVVPSSVPLILIWLFCIFPLTVLGGWMGHRGGAIQNFPVSEGMSKGYQDLDLQDDNDTHNDRVDRQELAPESEKEKRRKRCWRRSRIYVLFLIGGILPVACSFVEYAYGVAGPVYVGYFSDNSWFAILSFILFTTCIMGVSVLLYYKQIRSLNYEWWWSSFITGGSSGFYIFILSISWLLYDQVSGATMASYLLWFTFGSLAIFFMGGFIGTASCMLFNQRLYTRLLRRWKEDRAEDGDSDENDNGGSSFTADSSGPLHLQEVVEIGSDLQE